MPEVHSLWKNQRARPLSIEKRIEQRTALEGAPCVDLDYFAALGAALDEASGKQARPAYFDA